MKISLFFLLFCCSVICRASTITTMEVVQHDNKTSAFRSDSAMVQYVTLKDSAVVNFIKKWINILNEKEIYFKERGVLALRFNRYKNHNSDTTGFYTLSMVYGYKGNNTTLPNFAFYTLVNKRYIFIEIDPILARSFSISKKSIYNTLKKMQIWFLYPHKFSVSNTNSQQELVGNSEGDAGDLNIVLWEYTPALIIKKDLSYISTGFSVYGWSK